MHNSSEMVQVKLLSAEPAALRFDVVNKRFGQHSALRNLSFAIAPGQCAVVAGVNGAGKTTALRCLLDFARADAGSIQIANVDSRLPQARQPLAFLPERFVPPQHLSGHEALQWLAGLAGQPWSRPQTRCVIDEFALTPAAENRALGAFSKGMTQKIGLAAALHGVKPILVLDEPMSGLDVLARRCVIAALRRAKAQGRTIMMTSHSLAELAPICDLLIILEQGQLRFSGTPTQLCQLFNTVDLEDAFVQCVLEPNASH